MKITILALYGLLLVAVGNAQPHDPLVFERIQGLSQNTVYSIMQDKQSFLWIATANGLNRYDGMEMKIYKPSISYSERQMKGRIIRSDLLEDADDRIWFSTDITLNYFNKRNAAFTNFKLTASNEANAEEGNTKGVDMFANPLLKNGNELWLANSSKGMFVLNAITKKVKHFPITLNDDAGNLVFFMYNGVFDGKSKFWFASKNGLLSFDTLSKVWSQHQHKLPFYTLALQGDTLFAGSNNNIVWMHTKSLASGMVALQGTPNNVKQGMIRRLYYDLYGNTWAGDQTGNVFCKPPHTGAFYWRGNINGNNASVTNFPVYCFFADKDENLWVGADVLGLLKTNFATKVFKQFPQSFNEASPNKSFFIHSIHEDEDDKVWLGTFQNGLMLLDKKTNTTKQINLKYSGPPLPYGLSVPLIKKDSYGNIWTSANGHLYVKKKNATEFVAIKMPVPSNALQTPQMWSLSEYKDGWLIGTNIGLYFMAEKDGGYHLSFVPHLDQSRVAGTWVNGNKEVWVIMESRGIVIVKDLDKNREQKNMFAGLNIKSVLHDSAHQLLWIATSSGLIAYHLPSGAHKSFDEDDGLANSFIYGSVQNNNELWLSTNYGLSCAKTVFTKGSAFPNVTFTNFTKADGLLSNEFNTGAFHKAASGIIYFGTTSGVLWFHPSQIKPNLKVPKVRLINLLVNEEAPQHGIAPEYITNLVLPHDSNNIFFRFRAIDFNNGPKVKYMYQLVGWDKKWIHSNELNEVRYNNIAPGNYEFKVKASNGSGIWSSEAYSVSVNIVPPFWKTWWFISFIFLLVVALLVYATKRLAERKLRKQMAALEKQRELDKERQRISREMHDDIGAGLTQIVLMSESAKSKTGMNPQKELTEITDTSRQLVNNMGEIIWSLNPENKSLAQLMAHLREQLHQLLEYSGIEYNIHLPENGMEVMMSNEKRRNILLITKEIVHNAVKYSHAKNMEIHAELKSNELTFTIADDGIGFDTKKMHAGNGLKNIRHRIGEMNGEIIIQSAEGEGCRFTYSIPMLGTT